MESYTINRRTRRSWFAIQPVNSIADQQSESAEESSNRSCLRPYVRRAEPGSVSHLTAASRLPASSPAASARFGSAYDEQRNYFRARSEPKEQVSLAEQRQLFRQCFAALQNVFT